MRIGVSELIVVLIVALLVLGPDKLPRYARKLGAALAEFRKASDAATREIRENVVEPLEEAQRPLREAVEPVEDIDRAVRGNLKEVKSSLEGLGKAPPRKPEARTGTQPVPQADTAPAPEAAPQADTKPAPGSVSEPETVAAAPEVSL